MDSECHEREKRTEKSDRKNKKRERMSSRRREKGKKRRRTHTYSVHTYLLGGRQLQGSNHLLQLFSPLTSLSGLGREVQGEREGLTKERTKEIEREKVI